MYLAFSRVLLAAVLYAAIVSTAVPWRLVLGGESARRNWAGQTSDEGQKVEEVREQAEATQKLAVLPQSALAATLLRDTGFWVPLEIAPFHRQALVNAGSVHSRAPPSVAA